MLLRVLGPLGLVDDDGQPLRVGGPKERTFLAALGLAEGRAVSEGELIDAVWAGDPPPSARKTLQAYVSRARRELVGTLTIATLPGGYALRSPDPGWLDLAVARGRIERARAARLAGRHDEAAQALRQALMLWTGPSLSGVVDTPWTMVAAARLEEIRLAAIEEALDADLARGRHADVVAEVEELIERQPLREGLWRIRMLGLYAGGRLAEALTAYREFRELLVEELGVDPSPELRALHEGLLVHRSSVRPAPARTLVRPDAAALPAAMQAFVEHAFVGREEQVALLGSIVDGHGMRLVVITGEPGAGKTRLAVEFARRHVQGLGTVLFGRCSEAVGGPYHPFVQALEDRAQVFTAHPGETAGERDLRAGPGWGPAGVTLARQRQFDAVTELLVSLGGPEAPTLLVLDDLQWADDDSLNLLEHLVGVDAPMLVVATCRSLPLGAPERMGDVLAEAQTRGRLVRVPVSALSLGDVTTLVREILGKEDADALGASLHQRSGGNALFVHQLLHARDGGAVGDAGIEEELPRGVVDVAAKLLHHVPATARALAPVLALARTSCSLPLLQRVFPAVPAAELLDGVEHLIAAGVAKETASRLDVAHDLIGEAILHDISAARRQRMHRDIAEALASLPPTDSRVEARAHHLLAAGEETGGPELFAVLVEAARVASRHLALERSARLLQQALQVPVATGSVRLQDVASARLQLSETLHRLGRRLQAQEEAVEAARLGRELGDGCQLARAAQLTYVWGGLGATDPSSAQLAREALTLLPDRDRGWRARMLAQLAFHAASAERRGTDARPLAEEAVRLAEEADPGSLAAALHAVGFSMYGSPAAQEQRSTARRLIDTSKVAGDEALEGEGWVLLAAASMVLGDREEFERAAAAVADRAGDRWLLQLRTHWWAVTRPVLDGDLDTAEQRVQCCFEIAGDDPNAQTAAMSQLFMVRDEQGRVGELAPALDALTQQFPAWGSIAPYVYSKAGRHEEARRLLALLLDDRLSGLPRDQSWPVALSCVAEAVVDEGIEGGARLLEGLLEPYAGQLLCSGAAVVVRHAANHYLGRLARLRGDEEGARRWFTSALTLEERAGARLAASRSRALLTEDDQSG